MAGFKLFIQCTALHHCRPNGHAYIIQKLSISRTQRAAISMSKTDSKPRGRKFEHYDLQRRYSKDVPSNRCGWWKILDSVSMMCRSPQELRIDMLE